MRTSTRARIREFTANEGKMFLLCIGLVVVVL